MHKQIGTKGVFGELPGALGKVVLSDIGNAQEIIFKASLRARVVRLVPPHLVFVLIIIIIKHHLNA